MPLGPDIVFSSILMHPAHGALNSQNLLSSQNFEKLSHQSPPLSSSQSVSFIRQCEMTKKTIFSCDNNGLVLLFIIYSVDSFS